MNASDQILTERRMHGAMPRHSVHPLETIRPDLHIEVAFAAFLKTRMAAMAFAIIHNLQLRRRKRRVQLVGNFLSY